ncbi:MAG: Asp/Glu/hydantoin racemase [Spirochaetota bacterium]|nr:MAG: Asp/Glu/hydantoin racemase [Spirochaetota bacterium]
MSKLVLIHTVSPLVEVFKKLCSQKLKDVQTIHILDEPLLIRIQNRGGLIEEDASRLQTHIEIAGKVDAGVVLVTCSTISPLVDTIRQNVAVPVLKIDDAMIAAAVNGGTTIGVVATNPTTLGPTNQALEHQAETVSKKIKTNLVLVENALPALLKGDNALHDEKVKDAVISLSKKVDLVVLAQASMARVLDVVSEEERTVPILSSPHLALEQVKEYLESM